MEKQINEENDRIIYKWEWYDSSWVGMIFISNFEVDRTLSGGINFSLNTMESTIISLYSSRFWCF